MDFLKKRLKLKESDNEPGLFDKSIYPEEYQNKQFYFHEYCLPNGECVDVHEPICKLRVGEKSGYFFKSLTVLSTKKGILEWTLKKDNPIHNNYKIYQLHEKGFYKDENSVDKLEYRHYFKSEGKCSLDKWFVDNGEKVRKGDSIYQFSDSKRTEFRHFAEKDGYLKIIGAKSIYSIKKNELLYYISEEQILIEKPVDIVADTKEEICYVYLMHDTANNFYKIGISNKPEYRERTLQSEKPTIELMTSKKFPVRKIAESIEKSLHQIYSEKRLRGEWFRLNENDVKNIIESLK